MGWDRSPTPAQGKQAFELASLYAVVRAARDASRSRVSLGRGLYRADEAAELRLAIKLERVGPWLDQLDAERARAGSGDGSEG